tara:strand:+ start:579 stop:770 length:192 start_codon:yes stop_codon:yes gene_type:complete
LEKSTHKSKYYVKQNKCIEIYIHLPKIVIMLNRNEGTTKPKVDVEAVKNDREKIVKSTKIVKK